MYGYDNEEIISKTTDNESKYKHIEGVQYEIFLEDKFEIHDPLEYKYLIQEMFEDKYHKEEPMKM